MEDQQVYQTTVDSKIAYDYTNFTERTPASNPIEILFENYDKKALTQDNLKDLANRTSTDLATLYFSRRILKDSDNYKTQKRFDEILLDLKSDGELKKNVNHNTLFVFVPGLGYKSDKEIGADFGKQRQALQELGIPNTIIEVEEFGRVMTNAEIISKNIIKLSKTYSSIILISASKSSSEVAIALGKILRPDQTRSVKAWLSLCGVLRGTPFAREFKTGILSVLTNVFLSFHHASREVVEDMTPEYMDKIFNTLNFPPHIKLIQYVPVPLSGQVSSRAYNGYSHMKKDGPNDGRTMLADQLIDGGTVIMSFGSDHYFQDKDIYEKSMALGIIMQELIDKNNFLSDI